MAHARRSAGFLLGAALACLAGLGGLAAMGGPLDPPAGPVGSTFKTLQEVEPRISVHTLGSNTKGTYVIDTPGSYYLTADVVAKGGKDGIWINAFPVVLDLNGFSVSAPVGGAGINVLSASGQVTIRNGTVLNCTKEGIIANYRSPTLLLESIHAYANGSAGIRARTATLRGCTSSFNATHGIYVEFASQVIDCEAHSNTLDGIVAEDSATIEGCTVVSNGGSGISASRSAVVRGCEASRNLTAGITVSVSALVESNSCSGNLVNQIVAGSQCRIVGNNAVGTDTAATACIRTLGDDNTIEQNSVSKEGLSAVGMGVQVLGEHSFIGSNRVSKRISKPFVLDPKNSWGPVVDVYQKGDISATTGANHPAANFVH